MRTLTSSRAESPIILPNDNPPVGRIQAIIDRIVAAVQWFFGLCFPCCRPAPNLSAAAAPASPPPNLSPTAPPARPPPNLPAAAASARTPSPPPEQSTAQGRCILNRFHEPLVDEWKKLHPIVWRIRSLHSATMPSNGLPLGGNLGIINSSQNRTEATQTIDSFNLTFNQALEDLSKIESPIELHQAIQNLETWVTNEGTALVRTSGDLSKESFLYKNTISFKLSDLNDYKSLAHSWFYLWEAKNNSNLFDQVSLLYLASPRIPTQTRFLSRRLNILMDLYKEAALAIVNKTQTDPSLENPENKTVFQQEFNEISQRLSLLLHCQPIYFKIRKL